MSSLHNKETIMKKNYLKALGFVALSLLIVEAQAADPSATHLPAAAPQTNNAQSALALREQEAFDLFMHLLVCPVDKVPTWKEFVDKMAYLMEGNPKYTQLRASLLNVRDVTGIFGKAKISKVLTEHEAAIPTEIVNKTKSLGLMERAKRIKL